MAVSVPELRFTPLQCSVMDAHVAPNIGQQFYLWDAMNEPIVVDDPALRVGLAQLEGTDRPVIKCYPYPAGVAARGAVLLCGGGAFTLHGDAADCQPAAVRLIQLGYRCFVVDYRLQPYTQAEAAVDLARAIRFVRAHAAEYHILPTRIAALGFAAGGVVVGECMLNWAGKTSPRVLDPLYYPDALDAVGAGVYAVGLAYSLYGQPGAANLCVPRLARANLPRTYFCYGAEDAQAAEYAASAQACRAAGVRVEEVVLPRTGAAFGAKPNWLRPFAIWLGLPN